MVICLTRQVKSLVSMKNNLDLKKAKSERYTFDSLNESKNIKEENKNFLELELEKENAKSNFEKSYINFLSQKNVDSHKISECDFSQEFDYLERVISYLEKNRKQYKLAVILLATTINFGFFGATTSFALESLTIGYKLYEKGVEICKVICILGFMVEGGKCLLSGTIESLWKVAIRYSAFILSIRYLPDVVDWFFVK